MYSKSQDDIPVLFTCSSSMPKQGESPVVHKTAHLRMLTYLSDMRREARPVGRFEGIGI